MEDLESLIYKRSLKRLQEEVDRLTSLTSEKDKLIESLLERNSNLEHQLDALETENEMKACELAEQYKLNEMKTFYIQHLESKLLSLKVQSSYKLSDLQNKLTTDEYTKALILKIGVLHETLLIFLEKAERENTSGEFEFEIRKAKIANPTKCKLQKEELLRCEAELTNIQHELQTMLTEKRDMMEDMTLVLKTSVKNIDDLLLKHTEDIIKQVQMYEKELSPILNKLAEIEETQVEKYQEILEVLREPDDVQCSISDAIHLNESMKETCS